MAPSSWNGWTTPCSSVDQCRDSTVGLFKLVEGGRGAVRVQVKLGRTSVSTVEIVQGLEVGDQVILSDMSAWDGHERVKLN